MISCETREFLKAAGLQFRAHNRNHDYYDPCTEAPNPAKERVTAFEKLRRDMSVSEADSYSPTDHPP